MPKKWTPEERKAFGEKMAAAKAAKKPQTKTPQTNSPQLITLTTDQFNDLVNRLSSGTVTDKTPAPSLTPGIGLQLNPQGQMVGTFTKFNISPDYYPDPREQLLDEPRLSRFSMRENYFITWDIDSKPYETKSGISTQEPTFHVTLYQNMFDDHGEEMDRSIVIQTLHLNEDEELAMIYASDEGLEVTPEGLRELLDRTRYARIQQWLLAIFFPPRNFQLNVDSKEEAVGGTVVKVVTKSNVKGFGNSVPKIDNEELS